MEEALGQRAAWSLDSGEEPHRAMSWSWCWKVQEMPAGAGTSDLRQGRGMENVPYEQWEARLGFKQQKYFPFLHPVSSSTTTAWGSIFKTDPGSQLFSHFYCCHLSPVNASPLAASTPFCLTSLQPGKLQGS